MLRIKVFLDRSLAATLRARNAKAPTRRARLLLPVAHGGEQWGILVHKRARAHFGLDKSRDATATSTALVCAHTGADLEMISSDLQTAVAQSADNHLHFVLRAMSATSASAAVDIVPWLRDMPPTTGGDMQMLSFYAFFSADEQLTMTRGALERMATRLRISWAALGVRGRVYIAAEGLNAQLAVPSTVVGRLPAQLVHDVGAAPPLNLAEVLPWADFENIPPDAQKGWDYHSPFRKLSVIVRKQVLVDGLAAPLNLETVPSAVLPATFHANLDTAAVVLDVRNYYESEVGRFDGATVLNTETFRDSWPVLNNILKEIPKHAPVLMYCTGGIRCVKAAAYVTDVLGFKNVQRLDGGIVAYHRFAQQSGVASKFRGHNYVFDNRLVTPITTDVLAQCHVCGGSSSRVVHCALPTCHARLVLCPACSNQRNGACSAACLDALRRTPPPPLPPPLPPQSTGTTTTTTTTRDPPLKADDAAANILVSQRHRSFADAVSCVGGSNAQLAAIAAATAAALPNGAHMCASPAQAAFLGLLVRLSRARRVLEFGTFTGSSALAMALALPEGGTLVSIDHDARALTVARDVLPAALLANGTITLLHGDAVHELDILRFATPATQPFDMVYLDADKRRYAQYVDMLVESGLLRPGGLLVCDNVLFRGQVVRRIVALIITVFRHFVFCGAVENKNK